MICTENFLTAECRDVPSREVLVVVNDDQQDPAILFIYS